MALPALADSFTTGNFTYLTTSETTVEVTATTLEDGEAVIPETVTDEGTGKTYTVTSIGEGVFVRKNISSLTMPNTVVTIGNNAFQFCMKLEKVHLSEALETIGANAFQTTRNMTEINWPASLKNIKTQAFWNSMGYTGQIWLPKGVNVDDNAFDTMNKATSLWLDGQPGEWGVKQCKGCDELKEFYLNCTYPPLFDPSQTFYTDEWSWDGPTEITLYVPVGAKENYTADEKWPARFKTIEEYDFTNPDTTNPRGDTPDPSGREYETYTDTWSEDFSVAYLNVYEAGKLARLTAGHTDTLKEIHLSGKLNGDDILLLRRMCGSEQDGSIIEGAILETLDLTNCEIVPGGEPYFSYKVICYTEQDAVGMNMFQGSYSIKTFYMPKYATSIGQSAFENAKNMAEFHCNATVQSVGELAFYNCMAMESIELPDCCSTFGEMVFYVCPKLKSVKLPSSLTTIPFATFYFCESLPEITLPEGVKNIENLAFHNCKSLTTVNIPVATYKISSTAFGYCEKLSALNVDAANSDYCDQDGVLFNKNKTRLILYPVGKEQARYEVPEGTQIIGEQAMSNAPFKELVLPEGLTTILSEGVGYNKQLERVTIPASLASTDKVFYMCPAMLEWQVAEGCPVYSDIDGVLCNADGTMLLMYPKGRNDEEYTVPGQVKEIGEEAFYGAQLHSVTLSEGVETVGTNAFAMCEKLEAAYLPESMKLLKQGSFGLTALKEVHCAGAVPPECEYFADEAGVTFPFVGVDVANCKLYVPEEGVEAYMDAQVWCDFDIVPVTGVDSVEADLDLNGASYYTVDGRVAGADAKGIVIVRTADGRTFKTIRR